MTLFPQRPGTYFGANICKCSWVPEKQNEQEEEEKEEGSEQAYSKEVRAKTLKMGFADERYLALLIARRKAKAKKRTAPAEKKNIQASKELRMKRSEDEIMPTSTKTNSEAPVEGVRGNKSPRSGSRGKSLADKNQKKIRRTPQKDRTGKMGFSHKKFIRFTSPPSEPATSPSLPSREISPKKSRSSPLPELSNCYHCRKCAEDLCLKCRMPVDLCCCGISNFHYCAECEGFNDPKKIGGPFQCRKCNQKLCLVCRQHISNCSCPKPNFIICRTCETRRKTRCCKSVQHSQ